jgi:multidrug efflux system membrane fusion protein
MNDNNAEKRRALVLEPVPAQKANPAGARRNRRLRPILVIVTGIALILGVVWYMNRGEQMNVRGGGGGRGRGGRGGFNGPLPVLVQAAAKGDIDIYLDGLGTVTPLANVTVRTQISGQLMQVNFQEGQMVKKGDILAVIDPRPYAVALEQAQGQLLQAQAQLTEAQADLSRYVTLSQQDSISKQQVDAQRALVAQDDGLVKTDQAAVDNANLNLTYCHVTAPVAGRVGLRQVDPGNYVTPGDANGLVVLAQVQPISVIFTLPEDNIPEVVIRLNQGVKIPVTAFDRTETHQLALGTLATIDNEVDASTGTIKLRADYDNADGTLFANQFVNVRMLLNIDRDAIVIPTSAIELGQQGSFVYVVGDDNIVSARNVTLGPAEGERQAVISGLSVGDRVVIDGADKIKDGSEVVVQSPTNPVDVAPRRGRRRDNAGAGGDEQRPARQSGGQ